jgi:hypothetical protein
MDKRTRAFKDSHAAKSSAKVSERSVTIRLHRSRTGV